MEASARHLIRQDLFKRGADPFSGEHHRYWAWINLIRNKIKDLNLDAIDVITILEANTTGRPQKLVHDFLAAAGPNSIAALQKIWTELHERFGSGQRIANGLRTKLDSFPIIQFMHQGEKLQDLLDLCRIVECNMTSCHELQDLNQASGLRPVWTKLPEPIQNKWRFYGHEYETFHGGMHPPFSAFVSFLEKNASELTNLHYDRPAQTP